MLNVYGREIVEDYTNLSNKEQEQVNENDIYLAAVKNTIVYRRTVVSSDVSMCRYVLLTH